MTNRRDEELHATVATILERVNGIKEVLGENRLELKDQRSQIDLVKKKLYYLCGVWAAFEVASRLAEASGLFKK